MKGTRKSSISSSFITPLTFHPRHRSLSSSTSARSFKVHPFPTVPTTKCQRARLIMSQGWSETRQNLSVLEIDPDPQYETYPGVHYTQAPVLRTDDLWDIVFQQSPDEWVNEIVRTYLGWRRDSDGNWNDDHVPKYWKESYPEGPPNFIGDPIDFSPEKDLPVKIAVKRLTRSIEQDYKQIFRDVFRPLGFRGWTVAQLTPNRTRRAVCTNWIIYWYKRHYPDYQFSKDTFTRLDPVESYIN